MPSNNASNAGYEKSNQTFSYSSTVLNSPNAVATFLSDLYYIDSDTSQRQARGQAALAQLRAIRDDETFKINQICAYWEEHRYYRQVEALILEKQWIPTEPLHTRILVMVKLGRTEPRWSRNQRLIKMVLRAYQDSDKTISETAKQFLWSLETPRLAALDATYSWEYTRAELLAQEIFVAKNFIPTKTLDLRVRVAVLLKRGAEVLATPEELTELLKICDSRYSEQNLAKCARECLFQLAESSLDIVYDAWAQHRQDYLTDVINYRQYLPQKVGPTRTLVALQLGQWQQIIEDGAAIVPTLVQACTEDYRQNISEQAKLALAALQNLEAQQELCRWIIQKDLPVPQQIAVEKGYLPRETYEKVLYYFVTEQWDKYEALDFDHCILRTYYESVEAKSRKRLAEKVRKAGRSNYLVAIAGSKESRGLNPNLNRQEAELLVQLLAANGEWEKLWSLVLDLPYDCSVQIVYRVTQAGWQPNREEDRELLNQLHTLVQRGNLNKTLPFHKSLPPAVLRAKACATSRINDVAFSPNPSQIALGLSSGKVVLWDVQAGKQSKLLTGFAHSIKKVAFTENGSIVCTENTNSMDVACGVYVWQGEGQPFRVGEHRGPITGLEVLPHQEYAFTTGRDSMAKLWDVSDRVLARQTELEWHNTPYTEFWACGSCIYPDGSELALFRRGVTCLSLPELTQIYWSPTRYHSVCATYSPDASMLISGNLHGGLTFERYRPELPSVSSQTLDANQNWQTGYTTALTVQPNNKAVIMAKSDDTIHFNHWGQRGWLGNVATNGERITSVKVSPDGYFMGVGDGDGTLTLWDLRPMAVQQLLVENLRQATLTDWAALNVLLAPDVFATFNPTTQAALQYLSVVLKQRFRHEIEVEDVLMLASGDFDIELEG